MLALINWLTHTHTVVFVLFEKERTQVEEDGTSGSYSWRLIMNGDGRSRIGNTTEGCYGASRDLNRTKSELGHRPHRVAFI